MKLLTLIRHAKSSWKDIELADHERPLNKRGKRDAPEMGHRLAAIDFAPDLVISSHARRARSTAKTIIAELRLAPKLRIEPRVYLSGTNELLQLIHELDEELHHVALVGHNPDFTDLSSILGRADIENVPTCGVVRLELDVATWREVDRGCGRLIDFDYPKRHV
jgi:phosphohistidine phosphatase